MNKVMWLAILIVCIVFGFISQPVDKIVKKRVPSKWLSVIVRLFVYWIILMGLYGIATLLGFNIWE